MDKEFTGGDLIAELRRNNSEMLDVNNAALQSGELRAECEKDYRKELRKEIMRLRINDGVAWTACADMAYGDPRVAELRYLRDMAEVHEKVAADKVQILKIYQRFLMMLAGKEWGAD